MYVGVYIPNALVDKCTGNCGIRLSNLMPMEYNSVYTLFKKERKWNPQLLCAKYPILNTKLSMSWYTLTLQSMAKPCAAIIAFGKLKTEGGTFDIELLEVIDGWQGPARFQSESSADLPMRGKIYFHFMSSADFEREALRNPSGARAGDGGEDQKEADDLLAQVLEGYEIIYQVPAGYVRELFSAVRAAQQSQAGGIFLSDPRRPSLLSNTAKQKAS